MCVLSNNAISYKPERLPAGLIHLFPGFSSAMNTFFEIMKSERKREKMSQSRDLVRSLLGVWMTMNVSGVPAAAGLVGGADGGAVNERLRAEDGDGRIKQRE